MVLVPMLLLLEYQPRMEGMDMHMDTDMVMVIRHQSISIMAAEVERHPLLVIIPSDL